MFSPNKSIREQTWPFCKVGQGQPMISIWTNFEGSKTAMLYTKFDGHRPEEDFYHIWARRPSWSYDQDHLNNLSFTHPTEAPQEIWLWQAQWFLRRCLKMVAEGWTHADGGWRRPPYTISSPMSLKAQVSFIGKRDYMYFSINLVDWYNTNTK